MAVNLAAAATKFFDWAVARGADDAEVDDFSGDNLRFDETLPIVNGSTVDAGPGVIVSGDPIGPERRAIIC